MACALVALAVQAVTAHRENVALRGHMRSLEEHIRRHEKENRALRMEQDALQNDPFRIEQEMRRNGDLEPGERLLPEGRD
ncbi:MAG: hypothetical protein ACYTAF_07625 [Planctomycetota bacterium]